MPVRGVLVALLTAVALAAGTSTASAVIVHLANGKTLSYQPLRGGGTVRPFDAFFSNLDYNGGPVMASNTNYAVYWRPSGAPAYPSDYQAGVNQYLTDLAHDSGGHENVDSVATQYNDAAGEFANYNSHFGGALIDTDPYPANGCSQATICLTDAQLRAELSKYVKAQGLPRDLAHEYFLLTPPGVEDCFEASGLECSAGSEKKVYCAYHSNILEGEAELIYSNDPYVTGIEGCDDGNHPNGTSSDGALQGGLSHEHNESITDPEPNNAWTDFGSSEVGEIGDKCGGSMGSSLGTASNGASYNQVINGRFYWYQQEWSNQSHECLQRLAFSGAEPTATFTSKPSAGNEMTFNATGSTAPGGVARYNWQFNDGPGISAPVETTTPTVSHTFPEPGVYLVALTVFAEDGTSIGSAGIIATGDEGPAAAFSVTTATPTAGQPVSFDGSASTDADGSIPTHSWNFGDGSPAGSGAAPSHTYAAVGTYTVTLIVEDSSGQVATTSHPVVVGKGSQVIGFTSTAPSSARLGGPTYTVTATGGGSGNPVTFAIDAASSSVCSISGSTVSFIGVGQCTIDANQAGDANYIAAPLAQQTFAVGKGSQVIGFTSTSPSSARLSGPTYNLTATGGASGNPVTFAIDAGTSFVCSVSGATVSFIGVGTCTVDANQAGNAEYAAAPQAQQSFAVGKASQAIGFTSTAPGSAAVGGPTYSVAATASSGLPVSFSSAAPSVCSLTSSTVSFIAAGTCTIDADQAGNANYTAAPQAQQSFSVSTTPASTAAVIVTSTLTAKLAPILAPILAPNSNFTALGATVDPTTGAITFTESVGGPGTFSWLLTFQNGKFGVFASRNTKCKKGFLRLNGNCRPAKIVFARGSKTIAAAGTLSFTVKPGASALKALRNALKQKKGLPVTATLTFQSSRGGGPVSQTHSLTVRLKKKK